MVKEDYKLQAQGRVHSRNNSAHVFIGKSSSSGASQLPVQRKTAILNKENRQRGLGLPPHNVKAESKVARTKVLRSHQKENTALDSIRTEPEPRQSEHEMGQVKEQNKKVSLQAVKNWSPNMQQKVNPLGRLGNAAKEKNSSSEVEVTEVRTGSEERTGRSLDSLELSFQEKLQRWECDRQMESMELGEFELLEQAAEEMSFSSTSSFVMKVLHLFCCFISVEFLLNLCHIFSCM